MVTQICQKFWEQMPITVLKKGKAGDCQGRGGGASKLHLGLASRLAGRDFHFQEAASGEQTAGPGQRPAEPRL